jgi:hypothetical protein
MIRKLQSGEYRLYSRKVNPKTGKRRNLGTFKSRAAAEKHERDVHISSGIRRPQRKPTNRLQRYITATLNTTARMIER